MQGLGRGLFDFFSKENTCVGFDLLNNFDISKNLDKIIDETLDFDVFINNAYHYNSQHDVAKEWHRSHWDKDHILVNISSLISDPFLAAENIFPHLMPHIEEKKILNEISARINYSGSKCKSINILPGILNTDFRTPYDVDNEPEISKKYWSKIVKKGTILEVEDIVEAIDWAISSNNQRRIITSISINNR